MSAADPSRPTPSVVVRAGSATDVGRVREHNEDSVVVGARVFAVADGMGGHAAGEVASQLVAEALAGLEQRLPAGPEDVTEALHEANRRVLQAQQGRPELRGMGTTATGLVVAGAPDEEGWVVFNVGDSRVYRVADAQIRQVSRDHSEVRELLEAGLLAPEDVATHPLRNVITRSLGTDPAPDPDIWELPVTPGERFVVCSDGLSNELDDGQILELATEHPDPQRAAEELVDAAVRAGGRDNVSVVVVAVEHGPGEAPGGAA
ncbi:PP2C family protein-serine/threonine phosphatase [Phycicoccus endophyticus]|uniref:PP2C family protein-serine/threonine phosphatase n=1 Tax=Phycicoccus endophyticus TaxID=1690220 RepID=UPI00140D1DCC|nr:PP2C family serine/threonine-protein phosphatase [Phycicoccus endophyticus]NHI19522.1 serine/threonine-protein phosphatase [Phycicoccus endophyticus]